MSRAYHIKITEVRAEERLSRRLRAADEVSTKLELLPILPKEELAELLAAELERRGFTRVGAVLQRKDGEVEVSVVAETATVTVKTVATKQFVAKTAGTRRTVKEAEKSAKRNLVKALNASLEARAAEEQKALEQAATARLEPAMDALEAEFVGIVHRVTVEALKRKAARMGEIKLVSEDEQRGELTIVLEV